MRQHVPMMIIVKLERVQLLVALTIGNGLRSDIFLRHLLLCSKLKITLRVLRSTEVLTMTLSNGLSNGMN
jgi:hypothetical protein